MILRPGIEADDLQRIIKEDYELDSQDMNAPGKEDKEDNGGADGGNAAEADNVPRSHDKLDASKLYDALFVMSDTWCPDIDEFQYKEFFSQLDWRLKYSGMADNTAYDVL